MIRQWRETHREYFKEKKKYYWDNLTDWVVRGKLYKQGFNLQDITSDLMMLKRASIQLNRAINNSKEE
jgi:hypothetical protein